MRGLAAPALRAAAVGATVGAAFVAGVLVAAGPGAGAAGPGGARAGAAGAGARPGADSGVLDEAADRIAHTSLRPVDRATLDRAAVQGMFRAVEDPWGAFYDPRDFGQLQNSLDGSYTGLGVWLRRDGTGPVTVASLVPGSSAAAAGVQVGDEVTAVGGRPVGDRALPEVAAAMHGAAGTSVPLDLRRAGVTLQVTLRRERVDDPDVTVDTVAPSVGRIRVAAFTRGVGSQVREALGSLGARQVEGVVLDLRGDPGGLLDEAVEVASAFLDGGPVVSYARRDGPPRAFGATAGGDTATPVVVLVDGGTASAAEVVAGALQDRGRAVLVGSRTFGKGSVQEPARLSDGSALELTVAHYLTPKGRSLEGVGLDPDVVVAAGSPPEAAVRRAADVLSGLLADAGTAGHG